MQINKYCGVVKMFRLCYSNVTQAEIIFDF
jgi:hypothetical protein